MSDYFPKLRPGPPSEERMGLIERAIHIRAEIDQIFIDAEYWNTAVRKVGEGKIDPDPHGELKRARAEVERFIGPEIQ